MTWELFDAIYLINLPERTDRKRELERELRSVGLKADDSRLVWICAVRPSDAGEFPSIGARGCFLSHLACLKAAMDQRHHRVLIIEDDACFPRARHNGLKIALDNLNHLNWDIWYGGARVLLDGKKLVSGTDIVAIDSKLGVQTAHCIALQGDTIRSVRVFLELILTRPGGHPEAGPMHVDGAYSTWRALHPEAVTLVSVPEVCTQRSSRSDIAANRWFDRTLMLRKSVAVFRRLRNRFSK